MKTALLLALTLGLLATPAMAGPRFGFYVSAGGGCGPRYVAPPVCYAPPVRCAPRVIYRRPVCYAPVPVYRAPIVTTRVTVGGSPFYWR